MRVLDFQFQSLYARLHWLSLALWIFIWILIHINFIFIKLVIFKTKFCWNFSWDLSKYTDELSKFTEEFEDNCPPPIESLAFHEYLLSFKLYWFSIMPFNYFVSVYLFFCYSFSEVFGWFKWHDEFRCNIQYLNNKGIQNFEENLGECFYDL